jgi:hypothetical protein
MIMENDEASRIGVMTFLEQDKPKSGGEIDYKEAESIINSNFKYMQLLPMGSYLPTPILKLRAA